MWLRLLLWIWGKNEIRNASEESVSTSDILSLAKSNLNPLWWKLCRLNYLPPSGGIEHPRSTGIMGPRRSTMPTNFSVEAFLVHRGLSELKPSNIVLRWQEQSQNNLLQESQIGPLPSQRWWCCQHKALFLDCLEQPYFCQKHPFKKFTGET